jgi:hypothetical protein
MEKISPKEFTKISSNWYKVLPLRKLGKELGVDVEDDGVNSSDSTNENKAYSDNVVPFVPSPNYSAQNMPDYDYNHDYEG